MVTGPVEATATGLHIIVSPATLVPPAAASAWKIPAALSGPAPRRDRPASAAGPHATSAVDAPGSGTAATDTAATESTAPGAADAAGSEREAPTGDREATLARLAEAQAASQTKLGPWKS